jgi:hypothetical protein
LVKSRTNQVLLNTRDKPKKNNMSQKEKVFADGFRFERRENAPEFVVGRLSLKADEAIQFIKSHEKKGWINLNILTGRSGNHYVELDNYEPKQSVAEKKSEDIPKPTKTKKIKEEPEEEEDLGF